jgi:hypothetical protein
MKNIGSMLEQQAIEMEQFFMMLHKDERGDNENLGRMLILALVLIPLIIVIAVFGQDIVTKAKAAWTSVIGKEVKP